MRPTQPEGPHLTAYTVKVVLISTLPRSDLEYGQV
jgi:hypothetical protein